MQTKDCRLSTKMQIDKKNSLHSMYFVASLHFVLTGNNKDYKLKVSI